MLFIYIMENNINTTATGSQAGFNQAYYQQIRLNEIFTLIDRCFINPLAFNLLFQTYHYNIIANNLVSAYKTISAKLTVEEKVIMDKYGEDIDDCLYNNPPKKNIQNEYGKMCKGVSQNSWRILKKLLLNYRGAVEMLMDRYGFGNPSKKDPTKSSINF